MARTLRALSGVGCDARLRLRDPSFSMHTWFIAGGAALSNRRQAPLDTLSSGVPYAAPSIAARSGSGPARGRARTARRRQPGLGSPVWRPPLWARQIGRSADLHRAPALPVGRGARMHRVTHRAPAGRGIGAAFLSPFSLAEPRPIRQERIGTASGRPAGQSPGKGFATGAAARGRDPASKPHPWRSHTKRTCIA
jgi:hypothetical protein